MWGRAAGALFAELLVHVGLQHVCAPWPRFVIALGCLHTRAGAQSAVGGTFSNKSSRTTDRQKAAASQAAAN